MDYQLSMGPRACFGHSKCTEIASFEAQNRRRFFAWEKEEEQRWLMNVGS